MDDPSKYDESRQWFINGSLSTIEKARALIKLEKKYNARYQKGDIVGVYPDGTIIEKPSPNSKFVALRITGLSYENAKSYTDPLMSSGHEMARRRKMQLLWNNLPQAMQDDLKNNRYLIVTKEQAIPFLKEHIL